MPDIPHHAAICHSLLAGDIIDNIRHPGYYNILNDPEHLAELNNYLAPIKRRCTAIDNGSGYYLAYTDARTPEAKAAARNLFHELVEKIEPLIDWLRLCRAACADDAPLRAGDTIDQGVLLTAVAQSDHARQQLDRIATNLDRRSVQAKEQLNSVLDYLKKHHYLIPIGDSGALYRATARWDLLYEQLAYIAACENIDTTPPATQAELL